jgi:O-antigen biosynthesis protein
MRRACVILNYNNLDLLSQNVRLLLQDYVEIVVVDNGSDDGSAEYLHENPDVTTICNENNVGAAKGRNQGIQKVAGDILLLDSDVLYIRGSYDYLQAVMQALHLDATTVHFDWGTTVLDDVPKELSSSEVLPVIPADFVDTHYGLFRADVFQSCTFDEAFGVGWGYEDNDFYLQMIHHRMEIRRVLCKHYHLRKSSVRNLAIRGISTAYEERGLYFNQKWGL